MEDRHAMLFSQDGTTCTSKSCMVIHQVCSVPGQKQGTIPADLAPEAQHIDCTDNNIGVTIMTLLPASVAYLACTIICVSASSWLRGAVQLD